jgi:dipeptidyl aminopeptidase/acylaminoacyl peptidase
LNSNAVFEDLASDIAAGVEFLRSRPEIDRNRIGLAGVSQA